MAVRQHGSAGLSAENENVKIIALQSVCSPVEVSTGQHQAHVPQAAAELVAAVPQLSLTKILVEQKSIERTSGD